MPKKSKKRTKKMMRPYKRGLKRRAHGGKQRRRAKARRKSK